MTTAHTTDPRRDSDTVPAMVGRPVRFADFFGTMDFRDRSVVGDQVSQHAMDVAMEIKASIERTAGYLVDFGTAAQIEGHNRIAERMALRIAKDFFLARCDVCHRYGPAEVRCLHQECPSNNAVSGQEPAR